jgi:hypothetical protein
MGLDGWVDSGLGGWEDASDGWIVLDWIGRIGFD